MATLEQLSNALVNADRAGDVDSARTIAAEISRMRGQAQPPAPVATAPSGRHLSYEEGLMELQKQEQSDAGGQLGAGLSGFVQGLPIVGPSLLKGAQYGAGALSSLLGGGNVADNVEEAKRITQAAQEMNPGTTMAGEVTGAVAPMIGVGATGLGARALGITGPTLPARILASGGSGAAISAADTAARGGDTGDVLTSGLIGGGAGAAIPALGAGLKAVGNAIGERVAPVINGLRNPEQEAARRVGLALQRDMAANPAALAGPVDEAAARFSGIPLTNVDRGGETVRALARSAANQSPEARGTLESLASDRFATQSQRATNFIKRITGGRTDDLAYQDAIKQAATRANAPAYRAAYSDPNAQSVFTPRIQQLMQSPSFRAAIDDVPKRSADRAAVQGMKEIASPFAKNSQGAYVLRRRADGTLVSPSLEFWDHVQRNLSSDIGKAVRAGDNTTASELTGLKKALVDELDNTVSSFRTARRGAAAFFDAEDALDAGRKFANTPRSIPEARQAFAKFTQPEKDAFSTGYASELIDRIKASPDRSNVINSMFKSQAARESIELALGPQKARQIEAYVRVEDIADRLRGSLGNSTTARQLVELGLGGGAGYLTTGDIYGATAGALLTKGARYAGEKANAKVLESVANLLVRDNPSALQAAQQLASKNPAYMEALEKIARGIAPVSRGGAQAGVMVSQ